MKVYIVMISADHPGDIRKIVTVRESREEAIWYVKTNRTPYSDQWLIEEWGVE